MTSVMETSFSTADISFRYEGAFEQKSKAFWNPAWGFGRGVNKQRSETATTTMEQIETLARKNKIKQTKANPESSMLVSTLKSKVKQASNWIVTNRYPTCGGTDGRTVLKHFCK